MYFQNKIGRVATSSSNIFLIDTSNFNKNKLTHNAKYKLKNKTRPSFLRRVKIIINKIDCQVLSKIKFVRFLLDILSEAYFLPLK